MRIRNCEDSSNGLTLSSRQCYGASQEYGACDLQQCPRKTFFKTQIITAPDIIGNVRGIDCK